MHTVPTPASPLQGYDRGELCELLPLCPFENKRWWNMDVLLAEDALRTWDKMEWTRLRPRVQCQLRK